MKKYGHCFLCSTIVVNSILFASKEIRLSKSTDLLLIIICGIIIVVIGPVENSNRKLDNNEKIVFNPKLKSIIGGCVTLSVFFYYANWRFLLSMMQIALLFIVITMIFGKNKL